VVLLAGLAAISTFLSQRVAAAPTTDILDWRIVLDWRILIAGVVLGAVGVVGLYINAFFLRWSGKLIGGHASTLELRAVIAWGSVPNATALVFGPLARQRPKSGPNTP
jgi:hypothetical protein